MDMLVLVHIIIALLSIILSSYSLFAPSRLKLMASYSLVGLTLASGTYLVVSTGQHMLQACVSGLLYLAVVSGALIGAHRKLA